MSRFAVFSGGVWIAFFGIFAQAEFDSNKPFVSKSTIDSLGAAVGGGWVRDGAELEVTHQFTCKDPHQSALEMDKNIYKKLTSNDYENFKKMSKCKNCGAMDGSEDPALMKWDKVAHAIRMNMGYLSVSVEPDRITPKEADGSLALSYGSDLMDDIYFDTDEYLAISNEYGLRARKRWDSTSYLDLPSIRRILVGLKKTPPVNEKGLKTAYKIDDRFDLPNMNTITQFAQSIPFGVREINGSKVIIPSVLRLYQGLQSQGLLKDEGNEQQVLQLKPKTFLRSLRIRFHYNGIPVRSLFERLEFGKKVAAAILEKVKSVDPSSLNESDRKSLQKILNLAGQLSDLNLFAANLGFAFDDDIVNNPKYVVGNAGFSYELSLLAPERLTRATQLAEKIADTYRDLGYAIEHSAHWLAQVSSVRKEAAGLRQILFQMHKANPIVAGRYRAMPEAAFFYRNFLSDLLLTKGLDGATAEINDFGTQLAARNPPALKDFNTLTANDIQESIDSLEYANIEEAGRQVEEMSQVHKSLFFDAMGIALFNSSFWTSNSNIFIDTFDIVGMFKAQPLEVLEYDPRNPNNAPVAKVMDFNLLNNNHVITDQGIDNSLIGTYISNDVQLELGYERVFTEAFNRNPTPERKVLIDWMMDQILAFQKNAAKLKVLSINSYIKKDGIQKVGCSNFQWKTTSLPKGESSLQKLKLLDQK